MTSPVAHLPAIPELPLPSVVTRIRDLWTFRTDGPGSYWVRITTPGFGDRKATIRPATIETDEHGRIVKVNGKGRHRFIPELRGDAHAGEGALLTRCETLYVAHLAAKALRGERHDMPLRATARDVAWMIGKTTETVVNIWKSCLIYEITGQRIRFCSEARLQRWIDARVRDWAKTPAQHEVAQRYFKQRITRLITLKVADLRAKATRTKTTRSVLHVACLPEEQESQRWRRRRTGVGRRSDTKYLRLGAKRKRIAVHKHFIDVTEALDPTGTGQRDKIAHQHAYLGVFHGRDGRLRRRAANSVQHQVPQRERKRHQGIGTSTPKNGSRTTSPLTHGEHRVELTEPRRIRFNSMDEYTRWRGAKGGDMHDDPVSHPAVAHVWIDGQLTAVREAA